MNNAEQFLEEMIKGASQRLRCSECSVRYCKDRGYRYGLSHLNTGACDVVVWLWKWWQEEHPEQDTPYEQDDGIIRRIQVDEEN